LHVSDEEVVALYLEADNRSVSEAARLLNCRASVVRRILSEKGISTKPLSQVIAGKRLGRDNPNWRDDLTDEERTRRRDNAKTVRWRLAVYERDGFTCLKCGDDTGGNLNAHHIESYNRNRGLRWQVDNGATLCECCHRLFHKTFGYGDNTAAQFAAFLRQCVAA
jgi:5-methylcytosine-specific restriction endonuclease McrA